MFPARPSGASRSDLTYEAENITLQLTAIVELLEERGIMTQGDVLKRMKEVRDMKKVS